MTSNLVVELRQVAEDLRHGVYGEPDVQVIDRAADELERMSKTLGNIKLDSAFAERDRLRAALDKIRREGEAQTRGTTHYEGCASHHPWCRVLAFVQDALRPSPPYIPVERPADETPAPLITPNPVYDGAICKQCGGTWKYQRHGNSMQMVHNCTIQLSAQNGK